MSDLRIEPDLALCIAIFCGSTDRLQRICEIVIHVACEKHFNLSLISARLLYFSQMSARRGERNSSLTRTRVSAGGRAAGARSNVDVFGNWPVLTGSSRFGLLQLVALLSSHPLFYRILAWRDSLVFISPA